MTTGVARRRKATRDPRRSTRQPGPHRATGLSDADCLELYYAMLVSRRLSEQALRLAFQGSIDVAIPSDGHEAAQVASMRALRPSDPVYLFYRSVPAAYARGMTAREILLDYFGRADGPSSGGKNLPGHWAKRELNLMSVADRAVGYAVVGISVDGSDPLQVYRVMREAVEAARSGHGPALIEARVTRLGQHTSQVGDQRSAREVAAARRLDPIPRFGRYLRQQGVLDDA